MCIRCSTPAAPFSVSHDGGLDGASDGRNAAFQGIFRPQRRGLRPLREERRGCRNQPPCGGGRGVQSPGGWVLHCVGIGSPSRIWLTPSGLCNGKTSLSEETWGRFPLQLSGEQAAPVLPARGLRYCNGCEEYFQMRHMEVDHIIPRVNGGTEHTSNLQLLCGSCNRRKGPRSHGELLVALTDKGWIKRRMVPHALQSSSRSGEVGRHP